MCKNWSWRSRGAVHLLFRERHHVYQFNMLMRTSIILLRQLEFMPQVVNQNVQTLCYCICSTLKYQRAHPYRRSIYPLRIAEQRPSASSLARRTSNIEAATRRPLVQLKAKNRVNDRYNAMFMTEWSSAINLVEKLSRTAIASKDFTEASGIKR
jgi:hypothetical protein